MDDPEAIERTAVELMKLYRSGEEQNETRTFPGGLCREKRLEQLISDFGRDAGAVVAHRDRDRVLSLARC